MQNYLQDDYKKQEIIDGKIYFMSPTATPEHARISSNLHIEFGVFLRGKKCQAYSENLTIIFDDQNKVIPDLVVVCDPKKMTYKGYNGVPAFIIEIISPGSIRQDRILKFALYESYGVPEYWIISQKEKSIEQYVLTDGKYELKNSYYLPNELEENEFANQIISPEQFPELKIDLKYIFEQIVEND